MIRIIKFYSNNCLDLNLENYINNMPFPQADRVVYKKNTLQNVICQLRFPPVLKIDTDIPSSFQEKVKSIFPLYTEKYESLTDLPSLLMPPMPGKQLSMKTSKIRNHEFISEDETIRINLTRTFVALSTNKYKKWEDFNEILNDIIDAIFDIYSPSFITRIGLRYVNIFDKNKLNLADYKWDELLNNNLIGLFSSDCKDFVEFYESVHEIGLTDNESKVKISAALVEELNSREKSFMFDSDFFNVKKHSKESALEKLSFLHQRSTRLIRYIVKDILHKAMEPEEI